MPFFHSSHNHPLQRLSGRPFVGTSGWTCPTTRTTRSAACSLSWRTSKATSDPSAQQGPGPLSLPTLPTVILLPLFLQSFSCHSSYTVSCAGMSMRNCARGRSIAPAKRVNTSLRCGRRECPRRPDPTSAHCRRAALLPSLPAQLPIQTQRVRLAAAAAVSDAVERNAAGSRGKLRSALPPRAQAAPAGLGALACR